MPNNININPQKALISGLKANQSLAKTAQLNLANKKVEGYVALESHLQSHMTDGSSFGISTTQLRQKIDENLVATIREQNTIVSGLGTLDTYQQQIMQLFGEKGAQNSFAHLGKGMSTALASYLKDVSNASQAETTMSSINAHVNSITTLARKIDLLKEEVEAEMADAVDMINSTLQDLNSINISITECLPGTEQYFAYQDQRRNDLQKLSTLMGYRSNNFLSSDNYIFDNNDNVMMQGFHISTFSYDAEGTPPLKLTTIDGRVIDLSQTLYTAGQPPLGSLPALIKLHDETLAGLQSQLNDYTRVMRDGFNDLHNLGISMNPSSTLTGTSEIPDPTSLTGTSVFDGTTTISGIGTLRIAAVNPRTKLLAQTVDIPLQDGMTVQELIDAINNHASLNEGETQHLTAIITSDGQLSISADGNLGVVLGSVGDTVARLSTGDTYNTDSNYNASHFFGLNNLFTTGDKSVGGATTDIARNLNIRIDIKSTFGSKLSTGTLSRNDTPPTTAVLLPGDVSILEQIAGLYDTAQQVFNSTEISAGMTTTLDAFSNGMMQIQRDRTIENANTLSSEDTIYEMLSKQAGDISSVDEMQILQDLIDINNSITFIVRALTIANQMQQEVRDLIK